MQLTCTHAVLKCLATTQAAWMLNKKAPHTPRSCRPGSAAVQTHPGRLPALPCSRQRRLCMTAGHTFLGNPSAMLCLMSSVHYLTSCVVNISRQTHSDPSNMTESLQAYLCAPLLPSFPRPCFPYEHL